MNDHKRFLIELVMMVCFSVVLGLTNGCQTTNSRGANNENEQSGSLDGSTPQADSVQSPPCTPITCQASNAECGTVNDGCGGIVTCGDCLQGLTCGANGLANTCGEGTCTPTTCQIENVQCGDISDGCAGTLNCGGCDSGKTCQQNSCVEEQVCQETATCQPNDCGNKSDGCGGTLFCGSCNGDEDCDWVAGDVALESYDVKTYDVKSTTIQGVQVDYLLLPVTQYGEGNPWSMWGEGEVHSSGKYYGTFGNHLEEGGNAWLYEYDPETKKVRIVADALFAHDGYQSGSYGYGKVHGQVDEGPCGMLYFSTYRGSTRAPNHLGEGSYNGDLLLRYNPVTGHIKSLGEVSDGWMTPSTNLWRAGGLLYGESPSGPRVDRSKDPVIPWAYDINAGKVIWSGEAELRSARNIAIDGQGRAYFNVAGDDGLRRYTPPSEGNPQGALSADPVVTFPDGSWLRASTPALSDGTLLLVTRSGTAYRFDPSNDSIKEVAQLDGYVASVALSPDQKSFYAIGGGAHGSNRFEVQRFDIANGNRTDIVDLHNVISDGGKTPSGTYDVQISKDGRTIFMTANSGEVSGIEQPMFLAVHLN